MLNELVKVLYGKTGNFCSTGEFENFNQKELQNLLITPSRNKNLVKGIVGTNCGYLRVKLTSVGIRYFENGFKFDREIEKNSVSIHVNENNGNIAGISNGTQNIENINNQIDEIIKILDEKNIKQKEEIKKIFEEFKNSGDKKSLEKGIGILGGLSSAGSLVTGIIGLLR